ncbi:unnamed protein product [Musa acuminata subsp. burmannicoides]
MKPPLSLCYDSRGLVHLQLLPRQSTRQLPVEAAHQVRQRQLQSSDGEVLTGANPSAGSERHVLDIVAREVQCAVREPLWPELLRRLPAPRVSAHRPRVHEDARLLGDAEPLYAAVLQQLAREQQRGRRVQPEDLLHDCFQIRHLAHLHLSDQSLPAASSSSHFVL